MNHRVLAVVGAFMNVIILMVLAQVLVAAQTKPTATTPAKAWTQPQTAWGDPDLQGVYTFATDTPSPTARCARKQGHVYGRTG